MKRIFQLLLLFTLSLHAMEELQENPNRGQKRSHDEMLDGAEDKECGQSNKQQKLTHDACYELWLEKKQSEHLKKVEESTDPIYEKLSNEALFYYLSYMPCDMCNVVADELLNEIQPYYIARIAQQYPKPKHAQECYHARDPYPVITSHVIKIECSVKPFCRIKLTFDNARCYQYPQYLNAQMYHQWHFLQRACVIHHLSHPIFFIQDEDGNLISGNEHDRFIYKFETGKLFKELRDRLKGKLSLHELLLLRQSQILPRMIDARDQPTVDALKIRIKELYKEEKTDET